LMQPLPTPIPTSRSRCPAAPFLSISGLFTNQDWSGQALSHPSRARCYLNMVRELPAGCSRRAFPQREVRG